MLELGIAWGWGHGFVAESEMFVTPKTCRGPGAFIGGCVAKELLVIPPPPRQHAVSLSPGLCSSTLQVGLDDFSRAYANVTWKDGLCLDYTTRCKFVRNVVCSARMHKHDLRPMAVVRAMAGPHSIVVTGGMNTFAANIPHVPCMYRYMSLQPRFADEVCPLHGVRMWEIGWGQNRPVPKRFESGWGRLEVCGAQRTLTTEGRGMHYTLESKETLCTACGHCNPLRH